MLDILREYLDFDGERVISAKNCKSIIRLVLDILNELDSKPFGPLLAFPDYFVGQENKGLYSFIVQVLKFLKNHEDQNSLFVAELANLSTNDIVNTVSASNSSALIVDQLLKKDIFDKCFYLTDLSFSMDKPVDAKKVFLVPSDDLVGSSLDMVRDLRHRVTLLCELAQCGETLTKAMQSLSSALDEVKAAAYLKPIVGHLIFSAQEVSTPTKCVTEQLANAGCSNLSCTKECFMLCRANSNLFPLVFWVENGLLSPQSSQCKQTTDAVVSFPVPSQTGYVLLCVSGASQDDIFEVSTSDSFSADIQTLSSSVPLVAPAASLYVRAKSKHCDISKAKFFWKHLNLHSVDLDRVKCEVGQWSTSDSNQLLLTFSDFSPDRWSLTPLSARFSLDTGALFFSILTSLRERSSTDFLCDHTMCYDLTRLHSDEVRLSVFHRLFPNFSRASMLELLSEDPLSDCEKAGILALAFGSHVEVPFNVPCSFCETLCDPTSILGSIFHAVLGASPVPPFTPLFIRSQCCSTPVTRADLEPLIIFRNIDPQPKSLLLSTLDAMPPYSLNLLIERATGIWGLPALRCSRHPHIIITSSDQPNTVTFHPSLHLVAIGHFTSPADFVSQLTQL